MLLDLFNLNKIHPIHHRSNHTNPYFAGLNLLVAVHRPCLSLVTSNSCHWQVSHCRALTTFMMQLEGRVLHSSYSLQLLKHSSADFLRYVEEEHLLEGCMRYMTYSILQCLAWSFFSIASNRVIFFFPFWNFLLLSSFALFS